MFINFNDPTTTVNTPIYSAATILNSYFTTTTDEGGTIAYTNVSLTDIDIFSKSAKLTFNNTGVSNAYIYKVELYGTPAEVVENIDVTEIDQVSIDKYEEQVYSIDNEYIQTANNAQTRALMLLRDYKDYGSVVEIDVKGTPALQLNDAVKLDLDGYQGVYLINKTTNIMADGAL